MGSSEEALYAGLLMVTMDAPYELTFDVTVAPLVSVTTVITDATQMITPSRVRMERILFAQRDWSAS
jgi:hypothetical protein